MKPLRLAVLGAGLVGRRHIDTIRALPQAAELVAVVDPVADRSQFNLGEAAWFADVRPMLDKVKPEAVIIATPNNLHAPQGLLACERGIHFLVEKPVTATLEEAEQLVLAVERSGVKTLVGHHRRYLATVLEARRLMAEGALGALVAASVVWATAKPDAYFNTRWRKEPGGGPLLINAIHEIDMLRHLCGEMRSIGGLAGNAVRGFAVEDTAAAMFEFEGGCLGTLVCTDAGFSPWTIEQGSQENPNFPYTGQSAYRLVGTRGSLELPVLRRWAPATPDEIGWDKPIVSTDLPLAYRDPFQAQLEHFQRLVRLDEPAVVCVSDGANTLAATLAVAQSSREGRRVAPRRFGN
ncbi:MAG TPA: Gfo/Idh/MocA family oxidoreductase [Rhizomicrobium sp.]|nr:Gfo/Idh/MocA family oxidoreductase [Rhizomicrobium sp.]